MQYSTFAAIDIGSYDVILEIFEISKKQGIRSVDKICHRMELGKDTYTLGKIRPEMEEELCRVLADFVRIMEGYRVDEIARMLHLPQGTVKSRLRNARARLKDMLGEKGDVDDA